MKVVVMRHGEAEPYGVSDRERALTDAGRQQATAAGTWLREQGFLINRCLASPYLRTQQTAENVCAAYGGFSLAAADFLTPGSSPMTVVEQLQKIDCEGVLLISHNPMVSQLVNYLSSGKYQGAASMGTASMALFSDKQISDKQFSDEKWLPGCCNLEWLRHAPNFERAL
jgi:phosphohistidine phosphatase